jgi:hypothetical protein
MDKRRIGAMLPAVSARVPGATRRRAEGLASRDGMDCCSKDEVGRRPARAAFCTRAKPPGNPERFASPPACRARGVGLTRRFR